MGESAVYVMFTVNLIAIVAGVTRGVHVLVSIRDDIRDLRRDVGSLDPPSGLVGEMLSMKKEVLSHRDTLIEITAEMGLRRPGGRS